MPGVGSEHDRPLICRLAHLIAESSVADHSIRLSSHVRVVRIKAKRTRIADLFGHEHRVKEIGPIGTQTCFAEARPLIVDPISVEPHELRATRPTAWEA